MHKPESVKENEIYYSIWNLEIQTDHVISARKLDLVFISNKKIIYLMVDFAILANHRGKIKENKKINTWI